MKFTLFPRNDFNVEVCNHRWGRAMTYCENSDTLQVGTYEPIFYSAFKNNIRLGCFVSMDYTYLQNNKTSALAAKNNIISFMKMLFWSIFLENILRHIYLVINKS